MRILSTLVLRPNRIEESERIWDREIKKSKTTAAEFRQKSGPAAGRGSPPQEIRKQPSSQFPQKKIENNRRFPRYTAGPANEEPHAYRRTARRPPQGLPPARLQSVGDRARFPAGAGRHPSGRYHEDRAGRRRRGAAGAGRQAASRRCLRNRQRKAHHRRGAGAL